MPVAAGLAYEWHGDEGLPVAVFSSGLGGRGDYRDANRAWLSDSYRMLVYDHRGTGGSEAATGEVSIANMARDLIGLLDALELYDPVGFVGHAQGGLIGLEVAMRDPDRLLRALLGPFPSVSVIEVRGVLSLLRDIVGQMAAAIAAAAGVAVLAGIAVLVGAIAAAREARTYDSVVLRTLGMTRGQVLAGQAIEYALLSAAVVALALAIGLGGAWYVVVRLFDFVWAPDYAAVAATLAVGVAVTMGFGLGGAWRLLGVRPAAALREV